MLSERISMPVQMIFRFLVQAVRSSLCCGTPQPELRRAVCVISRRLYCLIFVKGEHSECISPLTTHRIKHAYQGWVVSRSDAIHLIDAVALSEGVKRLLQGRGQGEAKPPIARPDVRN